MPEIQFSSFADFLDMGGYAAYVWAAYGFFFLVLVFNLWLPVLTRRKILKQQHRRGEARQARAKAVKENEHVGTT